MANWLHLCVNPDSLLLATQRTVLRRTLKMFVFQSFPTLWDPMHCSPPGSSVHGILQAKILEWVCHVLLQGIFPTLGSNPALLHCRQILFCLSHQGSLKNGEAWKEKVGWSWIRTAGYQYIRVQKKKKSPKNFKIPYIVRQRKLYFADLFRNIICVHMLLEGIFHKILGGCVWVRHTAKPSEGSML